MDWVQTIQCPFCGGRSTVELDERIGRQQFVIDCEVCCRPMEVEAEVHGGEVVLLEVGAG